MGNKTLIGLKPLPLGKKKKHRSLAFYRDDETGEIEVRTRCYASYNVQWYEDDNGELQPIDLDLRHTRANGDIVQRGNHRTHGFRSGKDGQSFFGIRQKVLNLFLIGTGLIGSTMLKQINQQKKHLKDQNLRIKLLGLADINHMIFDNESLDISDWQNVLAKGEKSDLDEFIGRVRQTNSPNTILVDCTASDSVAQIGGQ